MKRRLSAAQVAELAELLEDEPVRAGMVDQFSKQQQQRVAA